MYTLFLFSCIQNVLKSQRNKRIISSPSFVKNPPPLRNSMQLKCSLFVRQLKIKLQLDSINNLMKTLRLKLSFERDELGMTMGIIRCSNFLGNKKKKEEQNGDATKQRASLFPGDRYFFLSDIRAYFLQILYILRGKFFSLSLTYLLSSSCCSFLFLLLFLAFFKTRRSFYRGAHSSYSKF